MRFQEACARPLLQMTQDLMDSRRKHCYVLAEAAEDSLEEGNLAEGSLGLGKAESGLVGSPGSTCRASLLDKSPADTKATR
jgi:hypothetical protein